MDPTTALDSEAIMSSMNVGGNSSPIRFQDVTGQQPIAQPTIQQTGGAPAPGGVAPSAFVAAAQNPYAPGATGGVISPGAANTADRLYGQVSGNGGSQEAFANYPYQARTDAQNAQTKNISDQLVQLACGPPPATPAQIDAFMKQATANSQAQLDQQFGPMPPNPNVPQPPPNAYNWMGRDQAQKELMGPLGNQLADMAMRGAPQHEIDRAAAEGTAKINQELNAKFGPAPEIRYPNQPPAGYPVQERNQENAALTNALSDKLVKMAMSGAPQAEIQRVASEEGRKIEEQLNSKYGPMTSAPYDAAKDTKEGYDQQMWQGNSQYAAMQAGGANAGQLQAYALQRQAQIDQLYPKQAMRAAAENEWSAVASKMQANGASPDQVKEYLSRKASEYKEPSPEETQVFIEKRARDEQQIQVLSQQMQAAQKKQFGFPFPSGSSDEAKSPSDTMKEIIQSFQV